MDDAAAASGEEEEEKLEESGTSSSETAEPMVTTPVTWKGKEIDHGSSVSGIRSGDGAFRDPVEVMDSGVVEVESDLKGAVFNPAGRVAGIVEEEGSVAVEVTRDSKGAVSVVLRRTTKKTKPIAIKRGPPTFLPGKARSLSYQRDRSPTSAEDLITPDRRCRRAFGSDLLERPLTYPFSSRYDYGVPRLKKSRLSAMERADNLSCVANFSRSNITTKEHVPEERFLPSREPPSAQRRTNPLQQAFSLPSRLARMKVSDSPEDPKNNENKRAT